MMKTVFASFALALVLTGFQLQTRIQNASNPELDAFWEEVARTVAEGDYEGYAATYHEDAILVNGMAATSYPIASALAGWKQGFVDTMEGRMKASVDFRFSQRLSDETTAHETGIFHYSAQPEDGELSEVYIHFEGLLVKKQNWKMMMEYQKSPATIEDWEALQ